MGERELWKGVGETLVSPPAWPTQATPKASPRGESHFCEAKARGRIGTNRRVCGSEATSSRNEVTESLPRHSNGRVAQSV